MSQAFVAAFLVLFGGAFGTAAARCVVGWTPVLGAEVKEYKENANLGLNSMTLHVDVSPERLRDRYGKPPLPLITDLSQRGLLDDVAVVVWGEMGRTPKINKNLGRDHFSRMSVTLSGCGIKPGVVHGEKDADGNPISKNPVNLNEFFATKICCFATASDSLRFNAAEPQPNVAVSLRDTVPSCGATRPQMCASEHETEN